MSVLPDNPRHGGNPGRRQDLPNHPRLHPLTCAPSSRCSRPQQQRHRHGSGHEPIPDDQVRARMGRAMSTVERAIAIAAEAHAGQVDKAGAPYVLHPLRIMLRMTGNDARIVAVLHDVCEDCPGWDFDRLHAEGFSEAVLTALDSVTKRAGESYEDFVRRACGNPLGREVKMGDLEDNMDLSRIAAPTERDFERFTKYRLAMATLQAMGAPA